MWGAWEATWPLDSGPFGRSDIGVLACQRPSVTCAADDRGSSRHRRPASSRIRRISPPTATRSSRQDPSGGGPWCLAWCGDPSFWYGPRMSWTACQRIIGRRWRWMGSSRASGLAQPPVRCPAGNEFAPSVDPRARSDCALPRGQRFLVERGSHGPDRALRCLSVTESGGTARSGEAYARNRCPRVTKPTLRRGGSGPPARIVAHGSTRVATRYRPAGFVGRGTAVGPCRRSCPALEQNIWSKWTRRGTLAARGCPPRRRRPACALFARRP
jgi:hypothetical protein